MSSASAVNDQPAGATQAEIVNDFSIQVATVNGSGSQTANLVLIRSLFQMGIPVSGKNLFPSNIAGLPDLVHHPREQARLHRPQEGNRPARRDEPRDGARGRDGPRRRRGRGLRRAAEARTRSATDLVFYPVPFDELVKPVCPDAKLRRLVRNMIYDGVLSRLLGIEMAEMEKALAKQLGKKAKAVALNQAALKAGYEYAEQNLPKRDPFRVERMDETRGKILIEANAAVALGAMMAGVTVVTWYPITPSSTVVETLIDYMKQYRMDKATGKATFAIVQAEDELASIGMALGAGWAGARSMTSTSGPGISLMSEFVGLGYYTEVPAVIVDVQRVGPSTGLPTRTAQGDILSTARPVARRHEAHHADPGSAEECYEFTMQAFDLAERFQTPVFVMTDLDLGMNTWMADPFPYPDKPLDRGKRLDAETLERLGELGPLHGRGRRRHPLAHGARRRPARVLQPRLRPQRARASTASAPTTTRTTSTGSRASSRPRGSGCRPRSPMRSPAPRWPSSPTAPATGRPDEARDQLQSEAGIKTSYLRLRAYPFTDGGRAVHRPPQARLRGGAEPRRADAQPAEAGSDAGPDRQAPQRALLRRAADRRADDHRTRSWPRNPKADRNGRS